MLAQQEELDPTALHPELNEMLAQERGWLDVGAGLTRILLGWGVLFGGIAAGIGLAVLSVFLKKHAMLWAFYGGLAIAGVAASVFWSIVMSGLLRCLLHSPERQNVRWYIFVCMLCLTIGPMLNIASYFTSMTQQPDMAKGVEGLRQIQFDSTGRSMQAACMVGTVGYNLAFILFLRGIGCCFYSLPLVRLAELHLLCYIGLVGGGAYLALFKLSWALQHPRIFGLIGVPNGLP